MFEGAFQTGRAASKRLLDVALLTVAFVFVVPSGIATATCGNSTDPVLGSTPVATPTTATVGASTVHDHVAANQGQLAVKADHLAFTGYDAITIVALGIGLILVGTLLVLGGRRSIRQRFAAAVAGRVVLTLGVIVGGLVLPIGTSAQAAVGSPGDSSLCADVPPVAVPEAPLVTALPLVAAAAVGLSVLARRRGGQKRPS